MTYRLNCEVRQKIPFIPESIHLMKFIKKMFYVLFVALKLLLLLSPTDPTSILNAAFCDLI